MQIEWTLKKFDALTPFHVYDILHLRSQIFVVEQKCIFEDADYKDQVSMHLMGYDNHQLIAYTRLVPPGEIYKEPSIGRVVTRASARGTGIGRALMQQSIDHLYTFFGKQNIKIGAQIYLKRFYESFGFIETGAVYLEDGIEHIHMVKNFES